MSFLRQQLADQPKIRASHWLLFLGLAGFALRLQQLSFQPLWGDEGWSFYFAMQPVDQLLALTAIDIHPPLYYLLLKGWLSIMGSGPEVARFLSVIVGTVLIPVSGVLGWRLFEARVAVITAAVVAVMPMAIYYSQEVRMYGLVTLLGAMSTYFLLRTMPVLQSGPSSLRSDPQAAEPNAAVRVLGRNRWLIAYVITTVAALYTMYYAAFIILAQLSFILIARLRATPPTLPAWPSVLAPFIYVGLLYGPWIVYAGPRLVGYIDNKRAVEGYEPLNPITFLGDHLVAFSLGHLPAILQPYSWVAFFFGLLACVGLAATFYRNRPRSLLVGLYLLMPLLIGYVINLVYPFRPRYFERTLLLAAPAYWLLMALGLGWLWEKRRIAGGAAASAMLLVTTVSLIGFFTVPRYPEEDYRPLLTEVAARATPQDTILASYQWQLGFYQAYLPPPRPEFFTVPRWGEQWAGPAGRNRLAKDLNAIFARSPRLWFPAYQAQGHLWEDEAEAAIAGLGYPALLEWHGPQTKLTLAASSEAPVTETSTANFENRLILRQVQVGQEKYEAGRGIVPVELTWQKQDSLGSEHRVNLRLVDAEGRTWASRDSYPQAGQAFFTDLAIGDILTDRHGLLIPAGTPPGQYRLLLSVRRLSDAHPLDLIDSTGQPRGAELHLGQIEVIAPEPPVGPAALPVQVSSEATFDGSVRLVGYSLGESPFKAGQALPLNLFWESLANQSGPLTVFVELRDAAGEVVVRHERPPIWPATEWRRGTLLRDPHEVALPPALPPGDYELVVGLRGPEQGRLQVSGGDDLRLTKVTTIDRPHNFEVPDPELALSVTFGDRARLIGLDLPNTQLKAGQSLPLTLTWQAIDTFDKSWTVFVHLTDRDGRIVSQQDQIPGAGQFPTTGWLPNEVLIDPYNLPVPADTLPGRETYWLKVGLYDPNDFTRLPVTAPEESINDHFLLEKWPISIK